MRDVPDISDSERWVVESTLKERYGKPVEVQLADVELRLDPAVPDLTVCPALVWKEQGAGFVISKVGDNRYRCQFFYSVREQYGTGKAEYDDLLECVVALLKLQADHASKRRQNQ
ncbi:MAG: hypothetical protein M1547_13320 [Gammaproteobacteria bacterium]|nr:hypothetical protein [Gammaproteobacteria bacterium]